MAKIVYEFDTASEDFRLDELLRIQRADDMARALYLIDQKVHEWYRNKTDEPLNPDTLNDFIVGVLRECNIELEKIYP